MVIGIWFVLVLQSKNTCKRINSITLKSRGFLIPAFLLKKFECY